MIKDLDNDFASKRNIFFRNLIPFSCSNGNKYKSKI